MSDAPVTVVYEGGTIGGDPSVDIASGGALQLGSKVPATGSEVINEWAVISP